MYRNDKKAMEKNNEVTPSATLLGHSTWSLRCAISGDGSTAISGDGKPSARTWNLNDLSDNKTLCNGKLGIRQCALSHDGSTTVVAGTGSKSSVAIFDTKSSEKLFEIPIPNRGMIPAGCALSPDGSIVAATFRASNRSKGAIRIVRWKADTPSIMEIDRSYSVWQIYLSSDARRIAYKFWHGTTSGIEMVDPWNDRLFFNLPMPSSEWAFSMNSNASIIVTASEWSLRVIPTDDPDSVKTLPGYTFSAFAHCSVSADGTYVAAPIRDHKFGVWHIPSSTLVHVLVGHSNRTNGCSITSDGLRVITCSNDKSVRLWDLTHKKAKSGNNDEETILVKSLKLMLDGRYKFSLTSETIEGILVSKNVHTVVDLLFAHTMILITKRTRDTLGVENLPEEQVQEIYSSVVGQLHSTSEAFLAQLIILHAEANKLIPSGFAKKSTGNLINASKQMIEDLKTTLMRCWRLVSNLPGTMRHEKLEPILIHQLNSVFDEIDAIRSGDHVMIYCAIAKCSLFFHPEFLTTLEDFTFGISGKIPTDALLQESKLTGLSFLEKLCPFDISSPKVLKSLISRDFISILSPKSKRCVLSAMSKSHFQNENIAQAYLQDLLGMKLYISSSDEFFDGKSPKSKRNENRKLGNAPYASPTSSLDTESAGSHNSISELEADISNAHELKEISGVWEKRAIESPEVQAFSQMNGMRSRLNGETEHQNSQKQGYLKSIQSGNNGSSKSEKIPNEDENTTNDGEGATESDEDDFEDNLILKVASEKSVETHEIEEKITRAPRPSENTAVISASQKPRDEESTTNQREIAINLDEQKLDPSVFEAKESGETLDVSADKTEETKENEKNIIGGGTVGEARVTQILESPGRNPIQEARNLFLESEKKELSELGKAKVQMRNLERKEETTRTESSTMSNVQSVYVEPVQKEDVLKNVPTDTEAQAVDVKIQVSENEGTVKERSQQIEKNLSDMSQKVEVPSGIVVEQVGKQQVDLGATKENGGGSAPQVMNVNVFIMTDEQKTNGSTHSIASNGDSTTKSPPRTMLHEVESVPVTVIKSVSSQGSNNVEEVQRTVSVTSSNGAGSVSQDSEKGGETEDEQDVEESKKKKSKRRIRIKKNIISLAKGTRNSFYGKKKSKDDKKKPETEEELAPENKT